MGFVYFIAQQNNDNNHEECKVNVKIGYSKNPMKRLKQLSTSSPVNLLLLGYFQGNMQDEKNTHLKFSKDKVNLEWFNLSHDLLDYINDVNLLDVYCDFDEQGIIRRYNTMKM